MSSHFKPWCALLGLLQAMLLVADAAAYPVDDSDATRRAEGGEGLVVFGEAVASPGSGSNARRDGGGSSPSSAAHDTHSVGFADALLREARDSPGSLFVDAPPGDDASQAFAGGEEPAPLRRALRALVNVNAQRNAVWSSPYAGQADQPAGFAIGEELAAALLKLETSLAGVVTQALDARVDEQGRVTFSLAGIEGFHITSGGGDVSLGHGDASVVVARQAPIPLERRISALDSGGSQQTGASRGRSPTQEFFDIVLEIFQYPLTWLIIFLLLLGQIALLIARFRNRRRSRRHRSRSTQAQPTVKRTRHRIRIKRVRPTTEPQQP